MRASEKKRRVKRKAYNTATRTRGYTPRTTTGKEWIQTFTGAEFYPLAPRPEAVRLADIAHALSLVCRFTGHVRQFYSVAEHSVRVSLLAEKFAERNNSTPARVLTVARWGLMHDASEAYLADIASPIKKQQTFALYREAEARLMLVIAGVCDLPPEEPSEVKEADTTMCATEARKLMSPHEAWAALGPPILADSPYAEIGADLGWSSSFAEGKFLERFRVLAQREVSE